MSCCDTKHPMVGKPGTFAACVPGALPGGLARTRFFDGMILTQADLENEQRFWRVKRRLTNRALGTGVVWGLRLRWDARRRIFALGPGYALDCCGNDLIVECPAEVTEAQLIATADPAIRASDPRVTSIATHAQPPLSHACVVLQYVECPEDARPVHLDPCAPPSSRCEPSRIRETTRLLLVPPPAPSPPDCLDDFYADLEAFRAALSPDLVGEVFPDDAGPAPAPIADTLPVRLVVTTPGTTSGTTPNQRTITDLPANTGATPYHVGEISGTRTATGARRGLIQFELTPLGEWAFYQGQVTDRGDVVDRVAAPRDFHQFWALEIEVAQGSTGGEFTYVVDGLGLEQTFGGSGRATAKITITGKYSVSAPAGATTVTTTVSGLVITVESDLAAGPASRGCFSELFSTGLVADAETAERDANLLLLAAAYAYFADLAARSPQAAQGWAAMIYRAMWRLVGVDLDPLTDAQKQELARLLAQLFACWCDAMIYPGPRCTDEHHGVYLGCATIGRGGTILAFDMWEQRRYVVLGPLVEHWLGVFGIAPIDVVVARFVEAICCVAGLPTPPPPAEANEGPFLLATRPGGIPIGRGSFGIARGDTGDGPVRDVGVPELVGRMVAAFVADNAAPLARFRVRTASGRALELVAPSSPVAPSGGGGGGRIDETVDHLLRRGDAPLAPLARLAARAAIAELAREVDPAALPELAGPSAELARALAAGGLSLAGLVDAGPEGLLARDADPAAVDDLAGRAEAALGALAEGVAHAMRKPAAARPSALLRDAEVRKAVAADAKKRLGLTRARVDAALDRAAARSP